MPEICRFFGIVITMYFADHPPPHFHVRYGKQRARIGIAPLRLLDGDLSPRVLGFAMEWAALHQEELRMNWARAERQAPLESIAPLE